MYRKVLVAGVTAAAIAGAGGVAVAATGSSSTPSSSGSSSSSSAHADHHKRKGHRMMRRLVHGQFVTRAHGGFVTHDIIRGTVSSVSSASLTVTAADKKSETFTVTKDTKVVNRVKGEHKKPTASSISKVSKGDRVGIAGTGTSAFTARHVVDITKK